MTYYLESQYLDLRKKYQAFEYEKLVEEGDSKNQQNKGKYNPKMIQQTSQTITQETYLFVKEKDVLLEDVTNVTAYFDGLLREGFGKKNVEKGFPFLMVKDRICHILEKYQEQPALLDVVISHMVLKIMASVKKYVIYIL